MSGTLKGRVDCAPSGLAADLQNRSLFVNLYNYFQDHVTQGQAELIASFYGNGGATGMDFHDGANPAGENAWACFRMIATASTARTVDYYVLIQWADSEAFGTGGGAPATLSSGADGVGVMVAYTESGASPWNGTTSANGADTKGTPVWVDNGSTLHIPQAANDSGAHSTNKEDLELWIDTSTNNMRCHIVGDADCTFLYADTGDDGDVEAVMWFGAYEPLQGLAIAAPIFMAHFVASGPVNPASVFDSGSGYDGQLAGADASDGVQDFSMSGEFDGVHDTWAQPASHGAFVRYLDTPIYLSQRTGLGSGAIGQIPSQVCTHIYNVPNNTANAALDRAYVPTSSSQISLKYSIPWGGSNPPSDNGSHVGITI